MNAHFLSSRFHCATEYGFCRATNAQYILMFPLRLYLALAILILIALPSTHLFSFLIYSQLNIYTYYLLKFENIRFPQLENPNLSKVAGWEFCQRTTALHSIEYNRQLGICMLKPTKSNVQVANFSLTKPINQHSTQFFVLWNMMNITLSADKPLFSR